MKSKKVKEKNTRKRFEYSFSKKKSTIVEFDIGFENGKKVATNITLTSNWRSHYPENPKIATNPNGEHGFQDGGVISTNGDIQQMIKRIERLIAES